MRLEMDDSQQRAFPSSRLEAVEAVEAGSRSAEEVTHTVERERERESDRLNEHACIILGATA